MMAVVNQSFPYFNVPTRTSLGTVKDFTKPLHVDCSVEYELPNSAKPPVGTKNEPLLMIHPSYYRREESQNRSPFINNLPQRITNYMNTSSRRSQIRTVSAYQSNAKTQINSCNKTNRAPLICSSNEAVNCNTDMGIFTRSPLTATNTDLTLHSDIQAVSDARYLTVMKDSKSFIADILPSVCQEVNNNSTVSTKPCNNVTTSGGNASARKQRTALLTNQQPAVGVAAVAATAGGACTGCNPCLEGDPGGYLVSQHRRMQQQPWSGMTAPQFASFPTNGKFRKTLDSPAVVAAATSYNVQKRSTPWSDGSVSTKRTKTAASASNVADKMHNTMYSASANFSQWCNNILPSYASTASSTVATAGVDCCKVCQQQQWNYTSHCRAASGTTASSIIWNNENMLRLFQV